MDFGIPHYKGCTEYARLLEDATARVMQSGDRQGFYDATKHRESCLDCQRMNAPLEEQLFGRRVTISHVTGAR